MTELENKLENISLEKESKIIPENIKQGVEIFGVTGSVVEAKPITKTLPIDANGMYNVTDYAKADVNVPIPSPYTYFTPESLETSFDIKKIIKEIPSLDLPNVEVMNGTFRYFTSLEKIGELRTPKVYNMQNLFQNLQSIKEIENIDTSNVLYLTYTFSGCSNLKGIPLLDCGKCQNIDSTFRNLTNLTYMGGLKDLGKNYPIDSPANKWELGINFSMTYNITHESLLNVLNSIYDIKSLGIKPQSIRLDRNIDKLTPEEIKIATDKGWNVSR